MVQDFLSGQLCRDVTRHCSGLIEGFNSGWLCKFSNTIKDQPTSKLITYQAFDDVLLKTEVIVGGLWCLARSGIAGEYNALSVSVSSPPSNAS